MEYIDSYFLEQYKNITALKGASINTESSAWAIDRLSILALKIYHMQAEATRTDASQEHKVACRQKLAILLDQRKDLSLAIDELFRDIERKKIYESI